jgi:hypothetical protein
MFGKDRLRSEMPMNHRTDASVQSGPTPADFVGLPESESQTDKYRQADGDGREDDEPRKSGAMDRDRIEAVCENRKITNEIGDGFHANGIFEKPFPKKRRL